MGSIRPYAEVQAEKHDRLLLGQTCRWHWHILMAGVVRVADIGAVFCLKGSYRRRRGTAHDPKLILLSIYIAIIRVGGSEVAPEQIFAN